LDWSLQGNIVTEQLTINCKKEITFALITLDGKTVLTTVGNIGDNTISVGSLTNGLYIITDLKTRASTYFLKQ
jgi:hypothetical protein